MSKHFWLGFRRGLTHPWSFLSDITVYDIDGLSFKNRQLIEHGNWLTVSCYFCLRYFPIDAISEWTDAGQTAVCPHCSVDAIVPGKKSMSWLKYAHEVWFTRSSQVSETP